MTFGEYRELLGVWEPELAAATVQTLEMALSAYAVGAGLGLGLALMRFSNKAPLVRTAVVYIELIRGIPALVLLYLIYFGLGSLGLTMNSFAAAVVGLGMNYAAYMAEAYRAGLESVDRGQAEAAKAIGMRYGQIMRFVTLPLAARVILPPMTNYLVLILQDTAVASLISAPELMLRARDLSAEYFTPLELYMTVGAIYFVLGYGLSFLVRLTTRHVAGRRLGRSAAEPMTMFPLSRSAGA